MNQITKIYVCRSLLRRNPFTRWSSKPISSYFSSSISNYQTSSSSSNLITAPISKFHHTFNHSQDQIATPAQDQIAIPVDDVSEVAGITYQVVETPNEFPFKIEDIPGERTITLTRECRGDIGDDVRVIVHMPADHSSTVEESGGELDDQNHDQHKDSVSDSQSSIRLVVTSTNFLGTTLEYGVIAYPDDFSIDSFCIKYADAPDEENIYYRGPDYAKLDTNLQKEFRRRLKIMGMIPSTTNFLYEYMANRDVGLSDSSNPPPPTAPESMETTLINDEGIPVDYRTEKYRQRGHPLVSAEDIRNSRKKPKDFIWIPYPYTRSEKLLWIEVPIKGFYAYERELRRELELELANDRKVESLFLDGEADNPYRCLPPKKVGDPPVFSEEMDKILYPNLRHMKDVTDPVKAWEESSVALKAYNDEIIKIMYLKGGRRY